jgi:hypothetical protein
MSNVAAAGALIAGLLLPSEAWSDPGSAAPNRFAVGFAVGFDAVLLRPIGFVATVVGASLFLPAALVSAPGGRDSIQEAWELFVLVPGKYVFQRPLGDF